MFDRFSRRISTRKAPWPRRRFLVALLMLSAALILPLGASAYISTGPGGDSSWNWQNPLPQGNDLLAQYWVGGTGWAVGRNGTVIKSPDSGATWAYQDPGISKAQSGHVDLNTVASTDGTTVVVAGANGVGRRSTDGGANWSGVSFTGMTGTTVNRIAVNGTRMVAVGNSGHIAYSADGGGSWTAANQSATTADLVSVCWGATNTWFAITTDGRTLRSTDDGVNWTSMSTSAYTYTSESFQSATLGLVAGRASGGGWIVRRTTDGGANWTNLASSENVDVSDVKILSTATAYLVTANGSMWKTANASAGSPTWTKMGVGQFISAGVPIRSIFNTDAQRYYVVGDGGLVARTGNGGTNWVMRSGVPAAGQLMASWFVDANTGWAVGANGVIQKTIDGGSTWTCSSAGTPWRG